MARCLKRSEGASRTRKSTAKKPSEPKLETDHYRNRFTGATVEEKKRNPKALNDWIAEHGLDEVKTWKI